MFSTMCGRIKRALAVLHFGLLILRWCGLRLFLHKMAHQLYARWIYLVVTAQLDQPLLPPSDFKCTVSLATSDDIKELFNRLHTESPEGRYQLLVRKSYHELGIGDCYVSRTAVTNEICAVRWLITPESVKKLGWEDRYPLEEDEYTTENVYTFERYRRLGSEIASSSLVLDIVKKQGFKRARAYIDKTNISSLKMSEKSGDKVCERILVRRFLFRETRKTLQRYDPPVTATEVLEMK